MQGVFSKIGIPEYVQAIRGFVGPASSYPLYEQPAQRGRHPKKGRELQLSRQTWNNSICELLWLSRVTRVAQLFASERSGAPHSSAGRFVPNGG